MIRVSPSRFLPFCLMLMQRAIDNGIDKEIENVFYQPRLKQFYLKHKHDYLKEIKLFENNIGNITHILVDEALENETDEMLPPLVKKLISKLKR